MGFEVSKNPISREKFLLFYMTDSYLLSHKASLNKLKRSETILLL